MMSAKIFFFNRFYGFLFQVNDKDFSITINAYFIVKWKDERLIVSKRNRTQFPHLQNKRRQGNCLYLFSELQSQSILIVLL